MKHFSLLFCFFAFTYCGVSQDTIHFVDKSVKVVKLHEIGLTEIKYHRFENQDGPLYIANKNDVDYIRFSNGSKEIIKHSQAQPATDLNVYKQADPITSNEKIIINGSRLSYAGKAVGESRLYKLIINEPIPEKKKLLINEYTKMKSYKKKQYLFGFVGLGAALVLPYAGTAIGFVLDDEIPIIAGFGAGAAVGITGAIVSGIFKHKRTKQRIEVAKLYNQ